MTGRIEALLAEVRRAGFIANYLIEHSNGDWQANLRKPLTQANTIVGIAATPEEALSLALERNLDISEDLFS